VKQLQYYRPFEEKCAKLEQQQDNLIAEIDRLNRLVINQMNEIENLNYQRQDLQKYLAYEGSWASSTRRTRRPRCSSRRSRCSSTSRSA